MFYSLKLEETLLKMSSDNGTFQPCHTETLETAKARAELRSMK